MNAFFIDIELTQPALLSSIGGGDPNSGTGSNFIPGSAVRGMLIERVNPDAATLNDDVFRTIFFEKAIFLNGYPLVGKQRLLPVPLSLRKEKEGNEAERFDFAFERPFDDKDYQSETNLFCHLKAAQLDDEDDGDAYAGELRTYEVKRQINVHISRRSDNPRTIYRYEALSAGQVFRAIILSNDETTLTSLHHLATQSDQASFGRSRGAGYGDAKLAIGQPHLWHGEYAVANRAREDVVVTMLADAIVRDERGAYTIDGETIFGAKLNWAFVQSKLVGGFNRTWGLPTPQTVAVAAGSVFVFDVEVDLLSRLQDMQSLGVGERILEGFGRIAINWQPGAGLKCTEFYQPPTEPPTFDVNSSSQSVDRELAQNIMLRIWRATLDRKLAEAVSKRVILNKPRNAQISRARSLTRLTWREKRLVQLGKELDEMKDTAKDQFRRASVGNTNLFNWLKDVASADIVRLWELLGVSEIDKPTLGGLALSSDDDLVGEYAMRLIDGVLSRATKVQGEAE